jgi:hypothetical protein
VYQLDNNYNVQSNLKQQKKESRPFSHGWYYQPRLKGVGAGVGVPPSLNLYNESGVKDPFSLGRFTRD